MLRQTRRQTHEKEEHLLCPFEFGKLAGTVYLHLGPEDFDLVSVHGGVGDEDLCILEPFRAVNTDGFVEDEP